MIMKEQLIKAYTYLVKKIIGENFLSFDGDIKDLESLGYLELISCYENFNKKIDGSFVGFASAQIFNTLKKYIEDNTNDLSDTSPISLSLPDSLTEEETKALFLQINNDGIRDRIINGNLWIVANVIHKYFRDEKYTDDLMSVGASSLIDFVDRFIPHKNNIFYKPCHNYIYRAIKKYLYNEKKQLSLDEIVENEEELDLGLIDYNLENLSRQIEGREIIENVLSYLTEEEKAILLMYYNGIQLNDIAKKFNMPYKRMQRLPKRIERKIQMVYKRFNGCKYESFEEKVKKYK